MFDINKVIDQLLDFETPLPAKEVPLKMPVIEEGPTFDDLIEGLMRGDKLIEEHKRGRRS